MVHRAMASAGVERGPIRGSAARAAAMRAAAVRRNIRPAAQPAARLVVARPTMARPLEARVAVQRANVSARLCAPQPIAFILSGALYLAEPRALHTITSFSRHVVTPLGGHAQSAAFVNLLVAHSRVSNKPTPNAASLGSVEASLRSFGVPLGGVALYTDDPTERLFPPEAPARCAWGCNRVFRYDGRDQAYCTFAGRLVTHWWGRMALSWDMMESWESRAVKGFRFSSVLLCRPDILFSAPLSRRCYDTSQAWYSAVSPPDGLWLFKRAVARDVMNTIRLLVAGPSARCHVKPCCGINRTSSYAFSWLPLCHWASEHWMSGLRIRLFDGVRASVIVHQGSATVSDINAGRDGRRKPDSHALLSRPTGKGGMHCGWA